MLQVKESGLYCEAGGFYIDPWLPVDHAIVTHAHSDHARWGMGSYLCASEGVGVLRLRVGDHASIRALDYGESISVGNVIVSLHPAGHILGSAQVRLELNGEVWVVSGDYKTAPDPSCTAFELIPCHTFVTESTFGLPIFVWPKQEEVIAEIERWWVANREAGQASILYGYALGKLQRILLGIDDSIGPLLCHGAAIRYNEAYRAAGLPIPACDYASRQPKGYPFREALILAPPGAHATPWMRRFGPASTAFASGWMHIRGIRRRRSVDRGFVISDHVDWPALVDVVKGTGAERVLVTHGYANVVARYLSESGLPAEAIATRFGGETIDDEEDGGPDSESEAS